MTSLLEGAKKLVSRGSDLGARVAGLEAAVQQARGRLDDALVDEGQAVVDRASSRLRLSAEHTVIALAGATGSGKSSTFNALTGLELSAVGVRRPTTSWATACVWGRDGAEELLEWLGIPSRHQVTRDSMLDTGREDRRLNGTVLLDLPDHDSTEVSHHLEVDRLVKLADVLVWVLDPQKYADAAVHDRYLKPLAGHAGIMIVVLNHIDTVAPDRRDAMVADVRRLLDADGLGEVKVLPISAREDLGLNALKDELAKRVAGKKATKSRLEADVKAVAESLSAASGTGRAASPTKERVAELENAFADAAGVPIVVDAVESSTRIRAGRATGWPVTSWISKLKPDPLKRLHLDLGKEGRALTRASRTSIPQATKVQRARVDAAVRGVADEVGSGLTEPWRTAVRNASVSNNERIGDELDTALAGTDLGVAKLPWWASTVRVLQWLLILTALAGGIWLGVLAVMAYLRMPEPPTPDLAGFPIPTLMLIGGVLLGIVLALFCKVLVSLTARSRARAADKGLRAQIRGISQNLVIQPIEGELDAYGRVREGLAAALR
ncbi:MULTISPECIES: GTPase family protein [unclassified Nocardioides]|uniref:GTPase family protein n=1 Tax=unclassified Nocardioides TaxID=2615069 RepID=UPI0006F3CFF7|nr:MULTISPECIES: GTPase [unclassified Nocardioides]KQY63629.1 ABC transporter [Nocardioides sp. Root140]KRF15645.1 ABC transporter [Nocardioides sp. Soil796]